jgi:prepilin-type N-terminal cleavage/methylation domain-containing protein
MSNMKTRNHGFTIVELLIVIVVIGILAAITIVAYNGVQARAATARRDSDTSLYFRAILAARINTGKTLGQITGNYWSAGNCYPSPGLNTSNIEPRSLPKTDNCWVAYYSNLAAIGAASSMSLNGLKGGDSRGNPYVLDENEGESGGCGNDQLSYFVGNNADSQVTKVVPLSGFSGCAT